MLAFATSRRHRRTRDDPLAWCAMLRYAGCKVRIRFEAPEQPDVRCHDAAAGRMRVLAPYRHITQRRGKALTMRFTHATSAFEPAQYVRWRV